MKTTAALLLASLAVASAFVDKNGVVYRSHEERRASRMKHATPLPKDFNSTDFGGVFGVDISSVTHPPASAWSCMKSRGNYKFAIIEAWNGGIGMNSELSKIVSDAWSGGMEHVDLYAFMCPNCGDAKADIDKIASYVKDHGVKFGKVWLDIEQCNGCWGSLSANRDFVKGLQESWDFHGISWGIYSSTYEWAKTLGGEGWHLHPVWYAHYDGEPSFSDWGSVKFGGWEVPAIKQFADHADNSCGVSVDRDWYP